MVTYLVRGQHPAHETIQAEDVGSTGLFYGALDPYIETPYLLLIRVTYRTSLIKILVCSYEKEKIFKNKVVHPGTNRIVKRGGSSQVSL